MGSDYRVRKGGVAVPLALRRGKQSEKQLLADEASSSPKLVDVLRSGLPGGGAAIGWKDLEASASRAPRTGLAATLDRLKSAPLAPAEVSLSPAARLSQTFFALANDELADVQLAPPRSVHQRVQLLFAELSQGAASRGVLPAQVQLFVLKDSPHHHRASELGGLGVVLSENQIRIASHVGAAVSEATSPVEMLENLLRPLVGGEPLGTSKPAELAGESVLRLILGHELIHFIRDDWGNQRG